MLRSRTQELSPSSRFSAFHHHINNIHKIKPFLNPTISPSFSISSPMHAYTSLFSPLTLSHNSHCLHHQRRSLLSPSPVKTPQNLLPIGNPKCLSTFVEHLACEPQASGSGNDAAPFEPDEKGDGASGAQGDLKHLKSPGVEVKELEELPEEWRRAKLAWLCKELPGQKAATLVRLLKAQKKWMRQEDATYLVVHCLRVRANEAGFRVYKWMVQQHWYRFDFPLATKIADHMGKEGKFVKCRDIFDDIINKNRVPSESTFHILVVAYLSANVEGCLAEACGIYNRMIQLGGYQPRLSLHNSLFQALVSKPGSVSKLYLKQAEFIYHNLVTSGLDVQKDIYSGLIWLHSYQDTVDKERIMSLREEMKQAGIEEGKEVLVSILRACSKESNVEEAERTWLKLLECDGSFPPQAFVYKMEVYAKVGQPMMSLETFRGMQERFGSATLAGYHKIIEVLCRAQQMELAESLMREFSESGLKPLMPSIIDMMNMYFSLSLHDKVQSMFSESLEKCPPNRTMYNVYLDSLVKVGNLDKAEEIFNHMYTSTAIGVNARSCNTILSGYLSSEDHKKAEKIYDLMCQKKFGIYSSLMEKLDLTLSRKEGKEPINLMLSKEQREILVGLLLGGLQIESDEARKKHMVQFEFNENSAVHSVLRKHLYGLYREWLHPSCVDKDDKDDVPFRFCTISHSYFGFYAEQFWPDGQPAIPKLIHRWLLPQVLAYWYMYGGHRTSSGDILLKLKGSREGVGKVVKTFKARSLNCRVKRKGKVYWIGFLGSDSAWFWKLVEPYVLHDLKESLQARSQTSENDLVETSVNFDNGSDFDEEASEYSDIDSP